ncbi:MAG: BLUF domain-containing protein [Verrucomicrobiota bacterium JB023]|nr:BLUF domain-containing protein [Verrucomicrobiota bacterium JB023]
MHLIVYTSTYTHSEKAAQDDLLDICRAANSFNPTREIAGTLFFHQGRFLQALEGTRENLEELMARIEKDPRHRDIVRIIDEPIEKRSFVDWRLDAFNVSDDIQLDPELLENFKITFLGQGPLEGRVFVDLLKKFCANPTLRAALVSC